MKLDLKLLSIRFFQAQEGPPVPTEGVSPYLLEHVLKPYIRNETVRYGDLDYDAFEDDELQRFSEYCGELYNAAYKLDQFSDTMSKTRPEPCKRRVFC